MNDTPIKKSVVSEKTEEAFPNMLGELTMLVCGNAIAYSPAFGGVTRFSAAIIGILGFGLLMRRIFNWLRK